MSEINSLQNEQLQDLHVAVVKLRKQVLELVDSYGYSASSLVSRTFEHDIEAIYGRRILKELKAK